MSGAPRTEAKVLWSTSELLAHEFPPIPWVVPGLITSGLTLLVGAPKLGKSWLSLAIATAVSTGGAVLGKIEVPKHEVLVLSLEDTPRRLQSRLQKIGAGASDNCHFATEWQQGDEGAEWLRKWLQKHEETRLIVVDTWGRFSRVRDGNDYSQVTHEAAKLKAVADEYDVAIVAVHHSKKGEAVDYLEGVLGSTGLAAVADATLVLRRGRGEQDATLSVTGRDVEEREYVVRFDREIGTWRLIGEKSEVMSSKERQEIYDLLTETGEPMSPKQIADALHKNRNTIKGLLRKMERDEAVTSMSGLYTPGQPVNSVNSVNPTTETTTAEFTRFTGFTGLQDAEELEGGEIPLF